MASPCASIISVPLQTLCAIPFIRDERVNCDNMPAPSLVCVFTTIGSHDTESYRRARSILFPRCYWLCVSNDSRGASPGPVMRPGRYIGNRKADLGFPMSVLAFRVTVLSVIPLSFLSSLAFAQTPLQVVQSKSIEQYELHALSRRARPSMLSSASGPDYSIGPAVPHRIPDRRSAARDHR
jgi:hypothetical protein